jgi:hypothetical protein
MANSKTPQRVNDDARPESDLSQVLAHGPAMSAAYGRLWGGILMLAAIFKASRGPLGVAALLTVAATILYKHWFR